jgi:hypothetical protein
MKLKSLLLILALTAPALAATDSPLSGKWEDVESGDYQLDFTAKTFSGADEQCTISSITAQKKEWSLKMLCSSETSTKEPSTRRLIETNDPAMPRLRMPLEGDMYIEFKRLH